MVATQDWLDKFELAEASFLLEGNYDHTAVLLCAYPEESQKRPFRFHNMWCNHQSLVTTVRQAWDTSVHGCAMYRVCVKLKRVKEALRLLNKEGFGDVEAVVIKAKAELQVAQSLLHRFPEDIEYGEKEKEAQSDLNWAKKNQHALLQQQAQLTWLCCGDENSMVFYQAIKHRRA